RCPPRAWRCSTRRTTWRRPSGCATASASSTPAPSRPRAPERSSSGSSVSSTRSGSSAAATSRPRPRRSRRSTPSTAPSSRAVRSSSTSATPRRRSPPSSPPPDAAGWSSPTSRSPGRTSSRSSSTSPARRCGTDMRQLLTIVGNDLRQRVRDRSVLIFGIVVPVALMFVMNLVFGDTGEVELGDVTVAASVADDDELGEALVGTLTRIEGLDVTVDRVAADEVRPRAEAGDAQLGIIVPTGFGDAVTRGEGATVDLVEGDGAGLETDVLVSVVRGVTEQMTAGTVAAGAAAAAGLPPEQLGAIAQQVAEAPPAVTTVEGTTATEQLDASAALVAGQAGPRSEEHTSELQSRENLVC